MRSKRRVKFIDTNKIVCKKELNRELSITIRERDLRGKWKILCRQKSFAEGNLFLLQKENKLQQSSRTSI